MPFQNTYVNLPDRFYSRQLPTPVPEPALIRVNEPLARRLGIDPAWLASEEGVAVIAGNRIPEGADPIATAYAGHQFGSFNPQLGDGRAILLGEVVDASGARFDIQLKGAGQTPYSRMGDGRAPLGPVLREYLVSEAMHALGVPTSRSLAAVTTGEPVYREETLPGAVLARVASSHIRIGTVQLLAAREDTEGLQLLVEHVIERHYPDLKDSENPALALLDRVLQQQASLVAKWQMLGFIHGVMNTDNMLLSGETIDYGPCAFMDTYDPATVYSSIDHGGRYAFRNQPGIANWNLAALAQALLPVIDANQDAAVEATRPVLERFPGYFLDANLAGLRRKFGLGTEQEDDEVLAKDFLELLESTGSDFTLAFRRLAELAGDTPAVSVAGLFEFPAGFDEWRSRWEQRCGAEDHPDRQANMLKANPLLIPRNHQVERAIAEATSNQDFTWFNRLCDLLVNPYHPDPEALALAAPPQPNEVVSQTFCGT